MHMTVVPIMPLIGTTRVDKQHYFAQQGYEMLLKKNHDLFYCGELVFFPMSSLDLNCIVFGILICFFMCNKFMRLYFSYLVDIPYVYLMIDFACFNHVNCPNDWSCISFFLYIMPYALADILGMLRCRAIQVC